MINKLNDLLEAVKSSSPKTIAVAAAEDKDIIDVLKYLSKEKMAKFILVGDKARIEKLLVDNDVAINDVEIFHADNDQEAAKTTVQLAMEGKCDVVMKGNLQTSTFLRAVLDKEVKFRQGN